jgi:hypothetical protein
LVIYLEVWGQVTTKDLHTHVYCSTIHNS